MTSRLNTDCAEGGVGGKLLGSRMSHARPLAMVTRLCAMHAWMRSLHLGKLSAFTGRTATEVCPTEMSWVLQCN